MGQFQGQLGIGVADDAEQPAAGVEALGEVLVGLGLIGRADDGDGLLEKAARAGRIGVLPGLGHAGEKERATELVHLLRIGLELKGDAVGALTQGGSFGIGRIGRKCKRNQAD